MTQRPLSVLRSDDRLLMAARVEAIAAAGGALCARRVDAWKPQCISLQIAAPGGLCATVGLDGEAGRLHALHFLHWALASGSRKRLSPVFGGVDTQHFCKATHVTYSFDAMCEQLALSLRLAVDGAAFQPARVPARQLATALF